MRRWSAVALLPLLAFGALDASAEPPEPVAPTRGALPLAPPAPPPRGAPRSAPAPRVERPTDRPPVTPTDPSPAPPRTPTDAAATGPRGGSSTLRYEPIFVPAPVFPREWGGIVVSPGGGVEAVPEGHEGVATTLPARPAMTREAAMAAARVALFREGPEAARAGLEAWASEAREVVDADAALRAFVVSERDARALGGLLGRLPAGSPLAGLVAGRHAEVLCRSWDHAGCLAAASALGGPDGSVELGGVRVPVAAFGEVRSRAVGVILPLSGTYASIGRAAEKALRLAFEAVAGIELIVRDSGGQEDTAAALARELIVDARVVAIIGPVGRKEVAAAVEVTRTMGIPHIVLASRLEEDPERTPAEPGAADILDLPAGTDGTAARDTAIRVRTSPEELAEAVARHAVLELGLRRVAVLRPDTEAAARAEAAFEAEVRRLGGTLTDSVTLDPAATDPKAAVKALLAPSREAMPSRARRKGRPIEARFDALFIPDAAPAVRRLVPFLEFEGLVPRRRPGGVGVQLLGIASWNHLAVIDPATRVTDNAIFADTWFDAPDDPRSDAFSKRFRAVHGEAPTAFHAEVFDVGAVVADAVVGVAGADHRARGELLRRLLDAAPRPGVTGVIAFRGGEAAPRPHLLTIDGDRIRRRASEEEEAVLRGASPGEGQDGAMP